MIDEMVAVKNWDIRHREAQLLKNLSTISNGLSAIIAFNTTCGVFAITVNGVMVGSILDDLM